MKRKIISNRFSWKARSKTKENKCNAVKLVNRVYPNANVHV